MTTNNTMPFPLREKRAGTLSDYDLLLGTEFHTKTPEGKQVTVRLVQLDLAAGVASPEKKTFTTTTATGSPAFQVDPCSAATDRPSGVGPIGLEALVDDDFFFVICEGEATVIKGDDAGNAVVGDMVACDDDADLGKVAASGAVTLTDNTVGRALNTTSSPDDEVVILISPKLLG